MIEVYLSIILEAVEKLGDLINLCETYREIAKREVEAEQEIILINTIQTK